MGNTPVELGYKPWALDYTPDKDGYPDLPQYVQSTYEGTDSSGRTRRQTGILRCLQQRR